MSFSRLPGDTLRKCRLSALCRHRHSCQLDDAHERPSTSFPGTAAAPSIRAFKVFSDLFGRNPQTTGKAIHGRPRSIQRLPQRSATLHYHVLHRRPMHHGILITRPALIQPHAFKFLLCHVARPPSVKAQRKKQQGLFFNGTGLAFRHPHGRANHTPLEPLEIACFQYVIHVIKAAPANNGLVLLDRIQARRPLLLQGIQFPLYVLPTNGLPFYS